MRDDLKMAESLQFEPFMSQWFSVQPKNGVALLYTGYFSQPNITAMGEVLRLYLEQNESSAVTRRKLFSTFIEMSQNILRYSYDHQILLKERDELRFGSICVRNESCKYYLESTNMVPVENSTHLQAHLETLRSMAPEEIKRAWKLGLLSETPATSKGANLGLLTIARDTSEPLVYQFNQLDATALCAFYLKATICHG